jgi:beta-phosphoglucomutase-like phosphatase (HAD superfamily)
MSTTSSSTATTTTTTTKAICIGIDGLVTNLSRINYHVWSLILKEFGYNLPYEDYLQFFLFQYTPLALANLLPYSTKDEREQIAKDKMDKFDEVVSNLTVGEEIHVCEGLKQFLDSIVSSRQKVLIAAVTDTSVSETRTLLQKLKVEKYVHIYIHTIMMLLIIAI